jgi:hypothetical protein
LNDRAVPRAAIAGPSVRRYPRVAAFETVGDVELDYDEPVECEVNCVEVVENIDPPIEQLEEHSESDEIITQEVELLDEPCLPTVHVTGDHTYSTETFVLPMDHSCQCHESSSFDIRINESSSVDELKLYIASLEKSNEKFRVSNRSLSKRCYKYQQRVKVLEDEVRRLSGLACGRRDDGDNGLISSIARNQRKKPKGRRYSFLRRTFICRFTSDPLQPIERCANP